MRDIVLKNNLSPLDIRINFEIIRKRLNLIYWDDLRFPVFGRKINTASGRLVWNYTDPGINFNYNARYPDEQLTVIAQMPHSKKMNTSIRPHVHWRQVKDATPNVLLQYRWYKNGDDIENVDFVNSIIKENAFEYSSGEIAQISTFPEISPPVDETVSSILEIKLYRDFANTSGEFVGTCPYNVPSNTTWILKEIDIHFQVDTPGSLLEFHKEGNYYVER